MVAHVASALGDGALALRFAQRTRRRTGQRGPRLVGGLHRRGRGTRLRDAGNVEEFNDYAALATRLIDVIADPEDKSLIVSQFAEIVSP